MVFKPSFKMFTDAEMNIKGENGIRRAAFGHGDSFFIVILQR